MLIQKEITIKKNQYLSTLAFCLLLGPFSFKAYCEGPTLEQKKFRPHMVHHQYIGCPSNSYCTKKTGQHFLKWTKLLKLPQSGKNYWKNLNLFKDKRGIPIEVWSFEGNEKEEGLIHWDSPCQNHNIKGQKILTSLAMINDFSKTKEKESLKRKLYLRRSLLMGDTKSNAFTTYLVPRGIGPLYLDGENLVYLKDDEGVYYSLHITPKGLFKIAPPTRPIEYPKPISCPESLMQNFATHVSPKGLYQGAYCQAIWNQESKKFQTMIFGWSCN